MNAKLYHHCALYRRLFRLELHTRTYCRRRARLNRHMLEAFNYIESRLQAEATQAIKEQNGANLLEIADDYSRLQYLKENYKEIL